MPTSGLFSDIGFVGTVIQTHGTMLLSHARTVMIEYACLHKRGTGASLSQAHTMTGDRPIMQTDAANDNYLFDEVRMSQNVVYTKLCSPKAPFTYP